MSSLVSMKYMRLQLKATLRAAWKEGEMGGDNSEDREAIFLQRCLGKLGVLCWLMEKFSR